MVLGKACRFESLLYVSERFEDLAKTGVKTIDLKKMMLYVLALNVRSHCLTYVLAHTIP